MFILHSIKNQHVRLHTKTFLDILLDQEIISWLDTSREESVCSMKVRKIFSSGRRGSRGGETGEFPPPFFWAPFFLFFFLYLKYWLVLIHYYKNSPPHFKILDPRLLRQFNLRNGWNRKFQDQKKPLPLYCWFIILLIYLFEQTFIKNIFKRVSTNFICAF